MIAQAHSPAPFSARHSPSGWLIVDSMGDSIAGLALRTGDHPAEEQEANAKLFVSSPLIADVLRRLLVEVDAEIDQRKFGGNSEAFAGLNALSVEAHAVLAAALIEETVQ